MTPEERLRKARESPPPYEERYVALVDVLGWSDIVNRSVSDPTAMPPVAEAAEMISMARDWADQTNAISKKFSAGQSLELDIRVSHFSDTFVFSLPIGTTAEIALTAMVGQLCLNLLERGHYTRGAIVRGLVRHTSNVLYGPSIIEAHELESRVAKYPRILVTPAAEGAFERDTAIRTDFDGLKHLDFLRPYKPSAESLQWLERLRDMAARRATEDAGHLDRVAKHLWFHGYVDEIVRRARAEMTV